MNAPDVEARLARILCDLLLLRPEQVRPESLLLDELDVDSITLLELAFTIEKEFGVDFPDVKASEETFGLALPEAVERLRGTPGGTTFFEFVTAEAVRQEAPRDRDARELPVAALVRAVAARVPEGFDAERPLAELHLGDLFRFVTVRTMARYVEYLVRTQPGRAA